MSDTTLTRSVSFNLSSKKSLRKERLHKMVFVASAGCIATRSLWRPGDRARTFTLFPKPETACHC